jgi:3D (Asp-Asp-Asp) domain-containing protein
MRQGTRPTTRDAWLLFVGLACGGLISAGLLSACAAAEAKEVTDNAQVLEKLPTNFKEQDCCGYPLGQYKLSFYWLAYESDFTTDRYDTAVFTRQGWPIGLFPARFVAELTLEGTGVLLDGRVINYVGRCKYGTGVCFHVVDSKEYPYGMGVRGRPLVPYRSVAVDPKYIPIGDALYFPELDGIVLPDGTLHDGCVRADDQGGAIRKREIDFFVLCRDDFQQIGDEIWWKMQVTPTLEEPRCRHLADSLP